MARPEPVNMFARIPPKKSRFCYPCLGGSRETGGGAAGRVEAAAFCRQDHGEASASYVASFDELVDPVAVSSSRITDFIDATVRRFGSSYRSATTASAPSRSKLRCYVAPTFAKASRGQLPPVSMTQGTCKARFNRHANGSTVARPSFFFLDLSFLARYGKVLLHYVRSGLQI